MFSNMFSRVSNAKHLFQKLLGLAQQNEGKGVIAGDYAVESFRTPGDLPAVKVTVNADGEKLFMMQAFACNADLVRFGKSSVCMGTTNLLGEILDDKLNADVISTLETIVKALEAASEAKAQEVKMVRTRSPRMEDFDFLGNKLPFAQRFTGYFVESAVMGFIGTAFISAGSMVFSWAPPLVAVVGGFALAMAAYMGIEIRGRCLAWYIARFAEQCADTVLSILWPAEGKGLRAAVSNAWEGTKNVVSRGWNKVKSLFGFAPKAAVQVA